MWEMVENKRITATTKHKKTQNPHPTSINDMFH